MKLYKELVKEVKLYVAETIIDNERYPLLYVLLDTASSTNYLFTMRIDSLDEIPVLMGSFLAQYRVPKRIPVTLHTFSESKHTIPPISPINDVEFNSLEKILESYENINIRENKYHVYKQKPKGKPMYLYRSD